MWEQPSQPPLCCRALQSSKSVQLCCLLEAGSLCLQGSGLWVGVRQNLIEKTKWEGCRASQVRTLHRREGELRLSQLAGCSVPVCSGEQSLSKSPLLCSCSCEPARKWKQMASSQRLVRISHCYKTANEVWGWTEADGGCCADGPCCLAALRQGAC